MDKLWLKTRVKDYVFMEEINVGIMTANYNLEQWIIGSHL